MHNPTRKNKRTMSGGRGKMSKITRRFKNHFDRFHNIDYANKMQKCEAWGSLNGIFKFVQAQNQTYKDEKGNVLTGLEKMIGNIQNTSDSSNSSNKEEYINAIDCLKKGGDTILSGGQCVSYSDFVNGGGAPPAAREETSVAASDDADSNNEPQPQQQQQQEEEEEEEEDASQPAATVDTSSDGGGRPRRRVRPSRRIKSRKSKKGRMTRRKHRKGRY